MKINTESMLATMLQRIDDTNAKDPNTITLKDGSRYPKELLYGQRMSETLLQFAPNPNLHLQIAARAQHIERWKSPRTDYPAGRAGYKKWRTQLGAFHASTTADIMNDMGFGEADQSRVKYLLQKRALKTDPDTQCLEDVACLVFLRFYLDDFEEKHEEEKIITIIQKTWKKMSQDAQNSALEIPFSDRTAQIIAKALH